MTRKYVKRFLRVLCDVGFSQRRVNSRSVFVALAPSSVFGPLASVMLFSLVVDLVLVFVV